MDRIPCPSIPHIGLFTSKQAYLVDQILQLSTKSLSKAQGTNFQHITQGISLFSGQGTNFHPIFTTEIHGHYIQTHILQFTPKTPNPPHPRANPRADPRATTPQPTTQPTGTQRIAPTYPARP